MEGLNAKFYKLVDVDGYEKSLERCVQNVALEARVSLEEAVKDQDLPVAERQCLHVWNDRIFQRGKERRTMTENPKATEDGIPIASKLG